MTTTTKLVELDGFTTAFSESSGTGLIWFGDDLAWHARVETPNGMFVLAKPDGATDYSRLEGLQSVLAGAGIRCIDVEWDGFWFPSGEIR